MTEPDEAKDAKETGSSEPARAEPAQAPATDEKIGKAKPEKSEELDPYWWTPWAVLVGIVLFGLLGFLGVLFPSRKGPTAADVPVVPPPTASNKVPSAVPH
jgi:hypothetical protein